MSSQPRPGSRMSLSSNLQAQQNNRSQNGDFLKLSQANIQSNIHNYNQFSRNHDDDNMSELSIPIYDNMSVASRRPPRPVSLHPGVEDDNVSIVSSVFTKQETSDVIPNDIKRFLNTFQNSKQDHMYRSKFTIPQEFDIYYYLLRYPRFGNIRRYTFKNVVGVYKLYDEKASTLYGLDDKYFRLKYSIPDKLNIKCYLERYPLIIEEHDISNSNISLYNFFNSIGQYDYILDSKYYRILLDIHKYFDIRVMIQRHKGIEKIITDVNIDDDIAVYEFYNSIDKEQYVLDDTYFRMRFDIPEIFEARAYLERYQEVNEISELKSSDTCDMYAYYHKKGIYDFALDEKYYRIRYGIADVFDCSVYAKRYKEQFSAKDTFKEIITFYAEQGSEYALDEKYYRLRYDVVDVFDCSVYRERYAEQFSAEDTFKEIITFHVEKGTEYVLDEKYYRLRYGITDVFDCSVYAERYKEQFIAEDTFKEIITFYAEQGSEYALDEKYYRLRYDVVDVFDCSVYAERYAEQFNAEDTFKEIIMVFVEQGTEYVLDEKYYRILHNIADDFDCSVYRERYAEQFNAEDTFKEIIMVFVEQGSEYPIDEKYYQIKYNVSSDFDWNHYGEAFTPCFDDEDDSKNMSKMFFLYSNDFHKKYDSKLYDHYLVLKNDLSLIDIDLYKKLFLFMMDSSNIDDEYVYQFCDWKITYETIYGGMMNGIVKDDRKFRTSMSFILRKTNFTSEKDIRRYISLHDFYNSEYYVDGEILYPTTKMIGKKVQHRVITTTPERRVRLVPRSQANPKYIINDSESDNTNTNNNDRQIIDDALNIANPEKNDIKKTLSVQPDYGTLSKINFSGIKQKLAKINDVKAVDVAVKDTAVVAAVALEVETNGSGRISSAIEQLTNAVKNNQDISQITSLLQNKDKGEDVRETLDLKNVNQNVSKSNKRGKQKHK